MAEWSRETPWRQGHLLSVEAGEALGLFHPATSERTLIVVATHDCDLAQAPAGEPMVELVVGCLIDKLDGNSTHAKVPRRLHIAFEGEAPCLAEFEAVGKTRVPKEKLADFTPRRETYLSPESAATFQFWLASRYRRSAFPDEFERRLKKETLAEKISKALKPHGDLISGIFFDVDDGVEVYRDGPDDTYTLDIYLLHPVEPDFDKAATAAQTAADVITQAFTERLLKPTNTWQHIELRTCEVVAESVLTYQQFKQLKRWRLEHLSLAADQPQPILAE
ncbi:hypothetical protein VI06_20565 [Aquitalea magnusonii]|nr:hypothetical protein VI06_20565 [Aquitalea magnusonii]